MSLLFLWLVFVCCLQIESQPPAFLKVEVRDADSGRPVHARAYLKDSSGHQYLSPGYIAYSKGEEQHFIAPGQFELQLPPGSYQLELERGLEFVPAKLSFDLSPGASRNEVVNLRRWIDMNRLGWYSADLHNHRKPDEMPALMLAEDLNLAPTLTDWIWEDRPISRPPDLVESVHQIDGLHVYSVFDKEVERLESGPGAVGLVGLRSVIPFEGYRLYPPNSKFCELARAQGGYVDAEKITWRDVAALVALNQIDFAGIVHNHFNRHTVELETDRWGMIPKERPEFNTIAGMPLWAMTVYYRFLNLGFRLPVSAGSASGVKAAPPGHNRVYAHLDESFNYDNWFKALKAGRSFATNGPVLFLAVDDAEPGAELKLKDPNTSKCRIRAESRSLRPLDRLEVVFKGEVIKTVQGGGGLNYLSTEFEYQPRGCGWFAARCFEPAGTTIRFAHTSPVYIDGGDRGPVSEEARFFVEWIDREISYYRQLEGFRDPAHRKEMLEFFHRARRVYTELESRTN